MGISNQIWKENFNDEKNKRKSTTTHGRSCHHHYILQFVKSTKNGPVDHKEETIDGVMKLNSEGDLAEVSQLRKTLTIATEKIGTLSNENIKQNMDLLSIKEKLQLEQEKNSLLELENQKLRSSIKDLQRMESNVKIDFQQNLKPKTLEKRKYVKLDPLQIMLNTGRLLLGLLCAVVIVLMVFIPGETETWGDYFVIPLLCAVVIVFLVFILGEMETWGEYVLIPLRTFQVLASFHIVILLSVVVEFLLSVANVIF